MNKSSAIFIFFSLFVGLSESFPKHYLVETEGGMKEESGKDMSQSGCVGGYSRRKIFKDGEKFYEEGTFEDDTFVFKCVCNSGKSLASNENKCNWQAAIDEDIDSCEDYCYEECKSECNMDKLSSTDDTSECSKICSNWLNLH